MENSSLQQWQENHEALKFKGNCLREKGVSYSIMPFLKKSTTKDTGYLSGMIRALYTDRRQNQNWHFNLNIQNCWSWGTQLLLLKLFFFLLWKLITDSLQFGMLSVVINCTAHTSPPLLHFGHLDTVRSLQQRHFFWGWHGQSELVSAGRELRYFLETTSQSRHRRLKTRARWGERKLFHFLSGWGWFNWPTGSTDPWIQHTFLLDFMDIPDILSFWVLVYSVSYLTFKVSVELKLAKWNFCPKTFCCISFNPYLLVLITIYCIRGTNWKSLKTATDFLFDTMKTQNPNFCMFFHSFPSICKPRNICFSSFLFIFLKSFGLGVMQIFIWNTCQNSLGRDWWIRTLSLLNLYSEFVVLLSLLEGGACFWLRWFLEREIRNVTSLLLPAYKRFWMWRTWFSG